MLKKIRVVFAIVSILAVVALFADFTGVARSVFGWLPKLQLVPAILSLCVPAIMAVVVLTLLFGRLYCSVICPLGIFQDFFIKARGWFGAKKSRRNRFGYKPASTKVRLTVLFLFLLLVLLGVSDVLCASLAGLIEPYSAFGRMANAFAVPVWDFVNNYITDKTDNYTFYYMYRVSSAVTVAVASVTALVLIFFSWLSGRDYCNTICPVGTVLGYLSRFSLFRPVIDTGKCNGCKKCARNCKASCIDASAHRIDYTRCVACFDCIGNCSQGAIRYVRRTGAVSDTAPRKNSVDASRRSFISTAGVIAGVLAAKAAEKTVDGGLTPLREKDRPHRDMRVVPPGASGIDNFTERCTGCQLCVSSCVNQVLAPSLSLSNFMQPEMNFTKGYCRPECNACSQVCPSGAIKFVDVIEKRFTQIGRAVVDASICISASEGIKCGNCARHCPAEAIIMVDTGASGMRPAVDETRCIGCGSCEYHCPVGSVDGTPAGVPAIHVEGIEVHHTI